MSYVSAAVGGMTGGVTPKVRTDAEGRFTLRWNADCRADIVYCDGYEVARNVADGTSNLHFTAK